MGGGVKLLKAPFNIIQKKFDKNYEIKQLKKNGVVIGENFHSNGSFIDPGFGFLIEIGNNVTMSRASILAHDGSTKYVIGKSRVARVVIGNNVFIGYQSIVLPGVKIGDNCIIGAGSLVTRDIPENSVAAGRPAKVICSISDFRDKHRRYMEDHPVFDVYHTQKSFEEKQNEKEILKNTWGYDE